MAKKVGRSAYGACKHAYEVSSSNLHYNLAPALQHEWHSPHRNLLFDLCYGQLNYAPDHISNALACNCVLLMFDGIVSLQDGCH